MPPDHYKHTPKQPAIKDGSPKFLQINLKMFNNYLTGNHCGSVNIDNNQPVGIMPKPKLNPQQIFNLMKNLYPNSTTPEEIPPSHRSQLSEQAQYKEKTPR
jgi:hypothetical protein